MIHAFIYIFKNVWIQDFTINILPFMQFTLDQYSWSVAIKGLSIWHSVVHTMYTVTLSYCTGKVWTRHYPGIIGVLPQWFRESSIRYTDGSLQVFHHRFREGEFLRPLLYVLSWQFVLHHELSQVTHHLRWWSHLDYIA